ncbi:glycosyltransferase family 1 protein [Clostridium tertium]|uniref:Glycosyltransferase family 1 protein n=1 Tax=Clostridium tertium TaxID=1559 RepID=A0A9X4B2F5_9CLOT|nr:glycosyltransferase family 1 protein [Clostridium tertium]MBP1870212.1 glycosyltransferase involved in cell wall biosynthesis [Clostridium tertium]MBU6134276.1 glycosyltransferase family 1 protein [Clostridium tertium]MDB1947894.1 glycosyltransferase family 1 protein [Clostridium tertium]MDC4240173.1 glycosyltransferase family 1 protein [Clostridium tertium]
MTKPIRVLMVNYKMQCAGIESFIMNMYRNIDREKVKIDFLVHYSERQFYDDEIERMGGKIYRLSIREDNNFIKYKLELNKFFNNHPEYKIVHGHMESFGVFYLREAKKNGIPIRVAHSHIAKRNSGIKGYMKSVLNMFYKTYATHLFACSIDSGKFIFGRKENFIVYNNAIDVDKFKFNKDVSDNIRTEFDINNNFVIGHVGRFNTQKNHIFLIKVFNEVHKRNDKVTLLLLGEGELENEIKNMVKKLGLENNIKFLGVRSDMDRIYQAMDLFILPSLFEGLPVSAIEAQAAGLKCILSDRITKETTMTDNIEYLSLNSGLSKWANEILKYNNNYERKDTSKLIKLSGYDIKSQAKQLQDFYCDSYKEWCENE